MTVVLPEILKENFSFKYRVQTFFVSLFSDAIPFKPFKFKKPGHEKII